MLITNKLSFTFIIYKSKIIITNLTLLVISISLLNTIYKLNNRNMFKAKTTLLILICFIASINISIGQEMDSKIEKVENLDLNKLQDIVTDIKDENLKLENRLQSLEGSLTKDNLNKIIKSANIMKFKSDINVLIKRYEAGENVLYHIIKETNQFNLSYKQLVLQSQFARLINPMSYPEFSTPLRSTLNSLNDKKPMGNISQDFSNISSQIPFLSNPFINSGVSIVSFFLAKFNKKSKISNKDFEKMMCVLNFITSTESDYRLNVSIITSLSNKIDNYNLKLKDFFDLYLKSIGYSQGYSSYIDNKINMGSDFFRPTREKFTNNILSDTTKIGIINYSTNKDDNVSYYIEQVKFQLSEYESLLLDIENSILNYEKFINKVSEVASNSCSGVQKRTKSTFNNIDRNIKSVKRAFEIVNKENKVPADQKRILFGL